MVRREEKQLQLPEKALKKDFYRGNNFFKRNWT